MSLLNIWGHIATVPTGSIGTQEYHTANIGQNNPPHHSIQTQGQPDVLSIDVDCTQEDTTTHLNVLGQTWPGNPYPIFHTYTSERATL